MKTSLSNRKLFGYHAMWFSLFLAVIACTPVSYFEGQQHVDPNGWKINDTVFFTVDIQDTVTPMDFMLNLRHDTDYPFSNIYFFVKTVYPDQNYSRDTLEILLSGKDGKWFGKGFGKIKEVQVMLKDRVIFPQKGTYRFEFVQGMREETLEGIEDLGIQIRKSQISNGR